jgi:uncharacterized protein involved in exopolysaccharide biosynthesis
MSREASSVVAGDHYVDLAAWVHAVRQRWWIVACGFVAGALVGVGFSFNGGSIYRASAVVSLGQPTAPGGAVLQGFGENPLALAQIAASASVRNQVARIAHTAAAALGGNVSVVPVGSTTTALGRSTPLISVTVQGAAPAATAAAANALASILAERTTAPYVETTIATFSRLLSTTDAQLAAIAKRIKTLDQQLGAPLSALNKLVVVSEVDNAEQRQGNLNDQEASTRQQLAFARNIESTKVITMASATKSTGRSPSTSLAIGALIGLILASIAAIVVDNTTTNLGQARAA